MDVGDDYLRQHISTLPTDIRNLSVEPAILLGVGGYSRLSVTFVKPLEAACWIASLDDDEVKATQFRLFWSGE